ncbi:MAG: hypothetical protein QM718_11800 [Steroidobacteraceae bacterium]
MKTSSRQGSVGLATPRVGQIKFGPKSGGTDTHMLAHGDGAVVTLCWAGLDS